MEWLSVRVLFQYDTLDEPIDEFLNDGFVENWRAFEDSLFLVRAPDIEAAEALIREFESTEPYVNPFGQRVRRVLVQVLDDYRVTEIDGQRDLGLGEPLEVYSRICEVDRNVDSSVFLKGERPTSPGPIPMMDVIDFYEHRARYRELRGDADGR